MKRKTAKEILAASFRELAEKKPVDKITVIDIAENCGYSTTTFYRHFKDKYDLMAWEYTRGLEAIIEKAGSGKAEWQQVCLACAQLFAAQRPYLKNLLLHTGGHDSFSRYMMTLHYEGLKRMILQGAKSGELDAHTEMCLKTYCHGAVDISCDYIMGQYDITPEELTKIFVDSLPLVLSGYLQTDL